MGNSRVEDSSPDGKKNRWKMKQKNDIPREREKTRAKKSLKNEEVVDDLLLLIFDVNASPREPPRSREFLSPRDTFRDYETLNMSANNIILRSFR